MESEQAEFEEAFNNYQFNMLSAMRLASLRDDEVLMRRITAIADSVMAITNCIMGGSQNAG